MFTIQYISDDGVWAVADVVDLNNSSDPINEWDLTENYYKRLHYHADLN